MLDWSPWVWAVLLPWLWFWYHGMRWIWRVLALVAIATVAGKTMTKGGTPSGPVTGSMEPGDPKVSV